MRKRDKFDKSRHIKCVIKQQTIRVLPQQQREWKTHPTLGMPTIPILRLLLGRPSMIFSLGASLGGMAEERFAGDAKRREGVVESARPQYGSTNERRTRMTATLPPNMNTNKKGKNRVDYRNDGIVSIQFAVCIVR